MFTSREVSYAIQAIKDKLRIRTVKAKLQRPVREDLLQDLCLAYATARGLMSWDKKRFLAAAMMAAERVEDLIDPKVTISCAVVEEAENEMTDD